MLVLPSRYADALGQLDVVLYVVREAEMSLSNSPRKAYLVSYEVPAAGRRLTR